MIGNAIKAGRDRLIPYQSKDPSPTIPKKKEGTHRKKEGKGKISRRQKVSEQLRLVKKP